MRGSCGGSGRHSGPGAGGSCWAGAGHGLQPARSCARPCSSPELPSGEGCSHPGGRRGCCSSPPSSSPPCGAKRGAVSQARCPGAARHTRHTELLTGRGAAQPPPRWCRPWRWSRRTGSCGPGGRAGESGGGPGPPRPCPELWMLTMASFCPWAVRTPTASGRPGRRSVLFPTSMSGSAVSAACWSEGQLMARACSLAGAASGAVGLCPFCSRCSPRPGWSQALLHKRPSWSRFAAAPTAPCGAQHSLPQGCCPAPRGLSDPPLYLDVLNPLADAEEAALGADVVEKQHAVGLAEVGLGDAPVPAARAVTAGGARPRPTPGQLWGPASPAGWVPEAGMAPAGSAHLSCPAVSQICSVVCSPSTSSCFIWKSTPARRSSQAQLPVPLPLHLSPGT